MPDQQMVKILLRSGAIDRGAPKREHTLRQAFRDDGKLRRDALVPSLPWQVDRITIPGTPGIGWVSWAILRFPQGARLRRVDLDAGTAPSTGPCTAWLSVDGTDVQNVSISAGLSNGTSGLNVPVPVDGIVRIRFAVVNGASDLMLSLFYTAGGGS